MGRSAKIRHQRRRRAIRSGTFAQMLELRRQREKETQGERWADELSRAEKRRLDTPQRKLGGKTLRQIGQEAEKRVLAGRGRER
jgi:hypothetical protein